jgi:radical SAM superfamily enzyme YgiQ (UPF0313 family)
MKPDIIFYQQYAVPYFGILALATHVKEKGYSVDVVIDSLEDDGVKILAELKPALIGISVMSPEHMWLIDTVKRIKAALPETVIIVGGIHAILYAEEILTKTEADLVCHSEGEEALVMIIEELKKEVPDYKKIPDIAFLDGSKFVSNEKGPLIQYTDDLVEEQSIYYSHYPEMAKDATLRFISSRGCPYKCSFCYNSVLQELYKGKGKYIRQKSVKNFIEEISRQVKAHKTNSIFFYDDLFTYNIKWLEPFLEAYKREINIPFMCTARANLMNEKTARLLGEAGCRTISFGVETGNYEMRRGILNKEVTDEQIINCSRMLRANGIKVQTANMFCLPDETLADAKKTIELNIKAGTDYAFTALFMPFPKMEITDYCIEKGYLKPDYSLKDLPSSFSMESVLNVPEKESIINVHRLAFFFIKWPWFYSLAKGTVSLTSLGFIFKTIFLFSNVMRHKEERGVTLFATLKYAWRLRRSV